MNIIILINIINILQYIIESQFERGQHDKNEIHKEMMVLIRCPADKAACCKI